MISIIKNMFNTSKIDSNAIPEKDEHQNVDLDTTVQSTVTETSNGDESMQAVIAQENTFAKVLQNPEDVDRAESKTSPRIVLTDCKNELIRLKNNSNKSNACLNDGKRAQRKCAKIAATRISKICWQLDETQARSLDFNRSQHKRSCAKVAENRISEIVHMTFSESDADDESEMSETEMSKAEISKAEMNEAEMSEAEISEAEMSESDMSESE